MEGPFGFPAPPPGMMPPPPAPAMAPIPPQPAGGLTEEMLQEKSRKYDLVFIYQMFIMILYISSMLYLLQIIII